MDGLLGILSERLLCNNDGKISGMCQGPLIRVVTAVAGWRGEFITNKTLQLLYLKPNIIYIRFHPSPLYLSIFDLSSGPLSLPRGIHPVPGHPPHGHLLSRQIGGNGRWQGALTRTICFTLSQEQ